MGQGEHLAGLPFELGQFEQGRVGGGVCILGAGGGLVLGQHADDQGRVGQVELFGCVPDLHHVSCSAGKRAQAGDERPTEEHPAKRG